MKKLLFQLDTDTQPSVFDTVVAYDGGADQVIGYAGCVPDMIQSMVEGAIFTRSGSNKKYTALFIVLGDAGDGGETEEDCCYQIGAYRLVHGSRALFLFF